VPNLTPASSLDLHEVGTRNQRARRLVTGCARAVPALGQLWQPIEGSLSDVPVLIAEIIRLRREIRAGRLDRANLTAAARATLAALTAAAAGRDTEPDPLWYLRDELAAQGLLPEHNPTSDHPERHTPGAK
jgi:hypothetical protein